MLSLQPSSPAYADIISDIRTLSNLDSHIGVVIKAELVEMNIIALLREHVGLLEEHVHSARGPVRRLHGSDSERSGHDGHFKECLQALDLLHTFDARYKPVELVVDRWLVRYSVLLLLLAIVNKHGTLIDLFFFTQRYADVLPHTHTYTRSRI